MNRYWTCYELDNGELATYSDYAFTVDNFIGNLLGREHNIKRFTEIIMDEQNGEKITPLNIKIAQYNKQIKNTL